ncbi:restriction endonuclease subunit S [Devosia sp. RR2S18]|uniref:restriction endonuclease subunit S n=1 Tax=Devosia rhizosphaerae TaxID=3049774 RepID=UPI00253F808C|nr:restriction endonuclease subunit S [Devosia sp. RR2S18]WIJ25776.1 restriction endonuclease subunit S [Devosia sp. RR2S18]
MAEQNLLSLSYGRIVRKDIDASGGLLPESFETYQIVEPGNIVMRLTDLQNDKRSIRQGLVKERGIITSAYDALAVPEGDDPRFWAYALLALDLAKYYYSLGGGVRQSIKFSDFPNDWIARPSGDHQKRIADFLDRERALIDQLIEKKQRLLEVLAAKRSSEILLGVSKGLVSSAHMKPSRLGTGQTVPDHWNELRLSLTCRFAQGKAHEPFFEDDGTFVAVTARFVSTGGAHAKRCSTNLSPARIGDILMVMSDLPNGRALARSFLVDRNDLYAVNQRVCVVTPKEGDSRYFSYQLNRNDQLLRYNDGINQTHLKTRYFHEMVLRVPPLEEQVQIADHLDHIVERVDAAITQTEISIDHLRELRSALITAAVTGQIDVTTWGKQSQTDRRLDKIQEEMGA